MAEVGGHVSRAHEPVTPEVPSRNLPTVMLFGFPVCTACRAELLEYLIDRRSARLPTHIVTLNPEMVLLCDNPQVREQFETAEIYVADGVGIVWAGRQLAGTEVPRHPGIDLAEELLEQLAVRGGSAFLLGGAPGVADAAAARLTERMPGLNIAGTQDGFFSPDAEPQLVRRISGSGADMLLVGMGCPRQEGFISMHRDEMQVPLMIGVGGTLDVLAGIKLRAPAWMRSSGLEWLYRGATDLARVRRMAALPRYVARVRREARRRSA